MNWVIFGAFFGVAGWALLRGRSAWLAMLSPGLYGFAFNTAATNNMPRYNVLLIPLLWVAVAIVLHRGARILVDRMRRGPRAQSGGASEKA